VEFPQSFKKIRQESLVRIESTKDDYCIRYIFSGKYAVSIWKENQEVALKFQKNIKHVFFHRSVR
jgi:hypothetical protein